MHTHTKGRIAHWPPKKKNTQKKLAQKANLHPIAPWVKTVAPPSARLLWLLPASSLTVTRAATKKWVSLPKTSSKLESLEKKGIDSRYSPGHEQFPPNGKRKSIDSKVTTGRGYVKNRLNVSIIKPTRVVQLFVHVSLHHVTISQSIVVLWKNQLLQLVQSVYLP